MEHNLAEMEVRILQQIIEASTAGELEHVRIKYLGRKGEISALLKNIGNLAPEQRPAFGAAVNALRNKVSEMIASRKDELDREALEQSLLRDAIDVSLPGEYFEVGGLHPLTKSLREITSILSGMGFTVYESRETETDEMNFIECTTGPASRTCGVYSHVAPGLTYRNRRRSSLLRVGVSSGEKQA